MLETKQFPKAKTVADDLEASFLKVYFGSNPKLLTFARKLIHDGHKDAAKELNCAISVLGTGADADLVIARIIERFFADQASVYEAADPATTVKKGFWARVRDPNNIALACFLSPTAGALAAPSSPVLTFTIWAAGLVWIYRKRPKLHTFTIIACSCGVTAYLAMSAFSAGYIYREYGAPWTSASQGQRYYTTNEPTQPPPPPGWGPCRRDGKRYDLRNPQYWAWCY
jgi:hypothetical protein